jgi:ketosteroid isomerase-like protein
MDLRRALPPAVPALAALALACSPRLIPGTGLPDSADNRAVYAVVQAYRAAVERRDAPGVLALVSPRYFDDAGTPDPSDDLDYAGLSRALPADLARVSGLRVEMGVTRIEVRGDEADAYVRFDARYRIQTRAGEIAKAQADVSRITLVREKGGWLIRSGL